MDVAVTFAIRQDCAAPIQDTPRWAVAKAFHAEAGVARAVAFSAGSRNSLVVLPLALAVPGGVPGGQIQSKVRAYDHAGRGAGFNRRDVEVEQSWCDDLAKVDKLLRTDVSAALGVPYTSAAVACNCAVTSMTPGCDQISSRK